MELIAHYDRWKLYDGVSKARAIGICRYCLYDVTTADAYVEHFGDVYHLACVDEMDEDIDEEEES